MIVDKSKFGFPANILNFRNDYKSISVYGVFYHDNISGEIDLLYTIPENISPTRMPVIVPVKTATKGFHFRCPVKSGSPNRGCYEGINGKEAVCTCSIDTFEEQVLLCKVGAPLPNYSPIMRWCIQSLLNMLDRADEPEVIEEILRDYSDLRGSNEFNLDQRYDDISLPAALVVVTDSEKYGKSKKQISPEVLMNRRLFAE